MKRKESKEGGGGRWETFPVPVRVPLNKLECKNTEEGEPENRRWSEHPHPGPTSSSVHNYNRDVQKKSKKSLGPQPGTGGRQAGLKGIKEPSFTSRVRGVTGV